MNEPNHATARQRNTEGEPADLSDPFDTLLNLEETYYTRGYELGYTDGLAQASLEARVFGIEKAFEKFVVMGKLRHRAEVWASRLGVQHAGLSQERNSSSNIKPSDADEDSGIENDSAEPVKKHARDRLARHVETLLLLTDPVTLSTANVDDAVADFDDRLKRSRAKVKVIERLLGDVGKSAQEGAKDAAEAVLTAKEQEEGQATQDIENLEVRVPRKR